MQKLSDGLRVAVYPVQVIEDQNLSAYAKLVYMILRSFVNPYKDEAWPSVDTISRLASVSRRTVQRAIRELEVAGYVVTKENFDVKNNRQTSNRYILTLPPRVRQTHPPVSDRHTPPCQTDTPPRVCVTPEYNNNEHNKNESNVCNDNSDDVAKEISAILEESEAQLVVQSAEIDGIETPIVSMAEYREDLITSLIRRRRTDKQLIRGAIDVWLQRQHANLTHRGYYMQVHNPVAYFFNCLEEYEQCRTIYDA